MRRGDRGSSPDRKAPDGGPSRCPAGLPSAVAVLVAPGADAGVDARSGDEEEGKEVPSAQRRREVPPEVDEQERDRRVEDPLLERRPDRDLPAAEVAPQEVRGEGEREVE